MSNHKAIKKEMDQAREKHRAEWLREDASAIPVIKNAYTKAIDQMRYGNTKMDKDIATGIVMEMEKAFPQVIKMLR